MCRSEFNTIWPFGLRGRRNGSLTNCMPRQPVKTGFCWVYFDLQRGHLMLWPIACRDNMPMCALQGWGPPADSAGQVQGHQSGCRGVQGGQGAANPHKQLPQLC